MRWCKQIVKHYWRKSICVIKAKLFSGVVHKFEFKIWVLIFSGEERIWRFRKSELQSANLVIQQVGLTLAMQLPNDKIEKMIFFKNHPLIQLSPSLTSSQVLQIRRSACAPRKWYHLKQMGIQAILVLYIFIPYRCHLECLGI